MRSTRNRKFKDFIKAVKVHTHLAAFFLPENSWLWVSFSFTGKCYCSTLSNNLISWPNHKLWRSYNLKGKKVCKYKPLTKNRYSKGKSDTSWIAQYQTEATVFDFFLSISIFCPFYLFNSDFLFLNARSITVLSITSFT